MADLSDLYNARIMELAARIPPARRLADADASASAHSKLCGSTISVDIKLDGDKFSDYGQTVKACLLGQSSASIVADRIIGTSIGEFRQVAEEMRRMLKENGPPPGGRWSDLAVLEPVREVRARHTSTLLVFEAIGRALDEIAARHTKPVTENAG